jgi:hypothetical protein
MEKQLTAVEWYCEKSIDILEELRAGKMTFDKWFKEQAVILKQAKEMEKQQIVNAHYQGYRSSIGTTEISEKYFNETFKSE